MTTYNVSFSLAEAQTGVSGHYPLLIKNSTYIPDSTLYVKTGDIVLFPSSLTHMVETKEGDNTRVSLAFNVFIKGTIGNNKQLTELKL